jgi:2,4-dienoyl-CoA reductase (NADPH2)
VGIKLRHEVNPAVVGKANPDAVIMAIGGVPATPQIPGIGNDGIVVNSGKLHDTLKKALKFLGPKSLEKATRLWMPVGKRVVVIGGSVQGCQLAEFLVKRGKQVTIVDEGAIGDGLLAEDPFRLFPWFEKKGVRMLACVKYERITDNGLVVTTKEGETMTLEADSILTALPLVPTPALVESLEGTVKEIYQIGDCKAAGFMHDAIADGSRIARMI